MLNNQLVSLAVKSATFCLEKKMGKKVHPLAVQWVLHFFTGNGKEMTLPAEAVEETKEAVLDALYDLWKEPHWGIHTAVVGDKVNGHWGWDRWFTSLSGVVGAFNYTFEVEEKGVKVLCRDKWDFNGVKHAVCLPVDTLVKKILLSLAAQLEINVEDKGDSLLVKEEALSSLNPGREFWTKWEFFISWDELEFPKGTGPSDYDWKVGGLSKAAIKRHVDKKQEAKAVRVLKGDKLSFYPREVEAEYQTQEYYQMLQQKCTLYIYIGEGELPLSVLDKYCSVNPNCIEELGFTVE